MKSGFVPFFSHMEHFHKSRGGPTAAIFITISTPRNVSRLLQYDKSLGFDKCTRRVT